MKKVIYLSAAALSMLSMAACSGNKCGGGKCAERPDEVYTGVIPMADADGMSLTLKLDYDDDKGNKEGDYNLSEQVLETDSVSASGVNVKSTFMSEGDFKIIDRDGKKYVKLSIDRKDSAPEASPYTFLISSDSTLTMVNDNTFEAAPDTVGLNYTLKLQR